MRKSKAVDPARIIKIKKALPSGALSRISESTAFEYQIVQRTLSSLIKRWDKRHTQIIHAAEKILIDAGVSVK